MGMKTNSIFKSFAFVKEEDKKKYDSVMAQFDADFLPYKNVIHKRYRFYYRIQQPQEFSEQFITELHKLAETNDGEKKIKAAQNEIEIGKQLHHYIMENRPKQRKDVPEEMLSYWQQQGSLSIEDRLHILFNHRL